MKKVILSAVAILAFGFANAQDSDSMSFGVKAGLNNSNFTGDADGDAATSFYVGGFVDLAVSESFHVQPELLYSMEGADESSVSYLKVPIMGKYYVAESFNLQFGPYIGFKVAAENDFTDELVKSMDFGLGIGAAYELTNGLFFDTRYNLGLQNVSEVDGFDMKTTCIQVGLGYKF